MLIGIVGIVLKNRNFFSFTLWPNFDSQAQKIEKNDFTFKSACWPGPAGSAGPARPSRLANLRKNRTGPPFCRFSADFNP